MPTTDKVELILNGQQADLPENGAIGLTMSFKLEEEGNFENKLSSNATGITLPATKANDQIFNIFHNPQVEDLTPDSDYRRNMEAEIKVNGVTLLKGKGLLQEAGFAETPIDYVMNVWGNNADWAITARMLTLYECLPTGTHPFDIPTIVASWAFDGTIEGESYVYAPVRYRQPFGDNDDRVNIYHLRPSLFVYWMLVRGFRALGYTLKSDFMDTEYFRRLVMPWTWGNFFDISNDLTKAIGFNAGGRTAPYPTGSFPSTSLYGGDPPDINNTIWNSGFMFSGPTGYVVSGSGVSGGVTYYNHYRIDDIASPGLYDNTGNYSFDDGSGTIRWTYTPPAYLGYLSNPVAIRFEFNLIALVTKSVVNDVNISIEVISSVSGTTLIPIPELSLTGSGTGTKGSSLTPTAFSFIVNNVTSGELLKFRIYYDIGSNSNSFSIWSSGYINVAPSGTPVYQLVRSTFSMSSIQVELGGTVNFKWYTVFKNYQFLDFLGGLVDTFNLQIQTDNINRQVLIEPTHKVILPDGSTVDGYHRSDMVLDWQNKHDLSKRNVMQLFSDHERQIDFTFKQDGGDGGQNLWSARYKGVYLNNLSSARFRDPYAMNNQSGIIAAVPGSARYILPQRFNTGNRQKVNRFFSCVLHVEMKNWAHYNTDIAPGSTQVAAQLIAIIPEGDRTGAESVDQIFEPKLAWYHGQDDAAVHGYMYWVGDPASPEITPHVMVPRMAAVYYGYDGETKPNLNYNDELINGVVVPGLMKTFFLRRLAIMRNGQLLKAMIRLNLNDITNPYHREHIALMNSLFTVVGIDGYQPISDDSCACTMWKVVEPEQKDADACYPSTTSITTDPAELPQDDLKYARVLIYSSDLPQV